VAPKADRTGRRWRSQAVATAIATLEAQLDGAWAQNLAAFDVREGSTEELHLAAAVADDPAEHDWRVVDAALDRLTCPDCAAALGAGPTTCDTCTYYDGLRFGARETDRPGVPPGNEHALRVSSAVARTRDRYSPRARVGYEILLPDLLAGELPTTAQAQAAKSRINKLTPQECDQVGTLADVYGLTRAR
jgi:ribosomal protein L40E